MAITSPGMRNERITVQVAAETKNASNEIIKTWSTLAKLWAMVKFAGGSESLENDKLTTEYKVEFKLYPRSDITSAMRVSHRGRVYHIDSVSPYSPHNDTVIVAHEIE